MIAPLPPAARLFVSFPTLLRQHGLAVAPEQTVSFLSAIELLGPRNLEHIRKAAVATLAPHPERRERFEALFDAHFLGAIAEPGDEDFAPDDDISVQEDSGSREILLAEEINETGQAATGAEALSVRMLNRSTRTRRCAASDGRCRARCRAGAATASARREGARRSIWRAACATPSAMMAM